MKGATVSSNAVVQTFIQRVKIVLDEDGQTSQGLERMSDLMRWLIEHSDEVQSPEIPAGNIHDFRQSTPLYTDETGLTLAQASFGPDTITPIHNHWSWGVVGVYAGRDLHQAWRRNDPGDGEGYADIELIEERILEPGDVEVVPPPPQDIHAQQGYDGETAYEFVLFGKNVMELPRLYFDPERKTAREVRLHG